jgi:hypothetical protein
MLVAECNIFVLDTDEFEVFEFFEDMLGALVVVLLLQLVVCSVHFDDEFVLW